MSAVKVQRLEVESLSIVIRYLMRTLTGTDVMNVTARLGRSNEN